MEKVCRQKTSSNRRQVTGLGFAVSLLLLTVGCSTKQIMEDNDPKFSNIDEEYSKVVSVSEIGKPVAAEPAPVAAKGAKVPVTKADAKNAKGAKVAPKASKKDEKHDSKNADLAAKPELPAVTKAETEKAEAAAKAAAAAKPDGYDDAAPAARPSQLRVQKAALSKLAPAKAGAREPDIEDTEGFEGRRPKVDPYTPGEKVTLTATYMNIQAGDISFEVLPFKMVNDRKAYHLRLKIVSSKTFNLFYAVNNTAETYLDYETMLPQTLTYDGKESAKIREYRTFFDWAKMEAFQWRREVDKKKGEKKKRLNWAIEPYSQNILSAVYYLRAFKLEVGKKYAFRVADEGKNYVFSANVIRREKLKTDAGEFNTLVIQPDYKIDGKFTPAGTNTIWVTDDDRKLPIRVEAKVKIGTFVAKLKSIEGVK